MSTKPIIAITMGDPSGIGPEIIVKALHNREILEMCLPVIIGDNLAIERAVKICGSEIKISTISRIEEARESSIDTVSLLAVSALNEKDMIYGNPSKSAGDAVYRYICAAAQLCLSNGVDAMVTAPINKEAMHRAGHDYPGHTELLAELCHTDDFVMMLAGDILRVGLVTIHEALSDVPQLVTFDKVLKTIRITANAVAKLTGKANPKIAVLALNPHCGEGGKFGREDADVIEPAINCAIKEGIDAVGPLSADTLFYFASQGLYDGVVAMYHDQGLIPLKMLHFDDAVNITLGLPIIRTSVDHGTAYNLVGSGKASEKSLLAAIQMAVELSQNI